MVKLWYFIGMFNVGGTDRVAHVDHDALDDGEDGYDRARAIGEHWFNDGVNIEGDMVEFDRVVVTSEEHEIALDISRVKDVL